MKKVIFHTVFLILFASKVLAQGNSTGAHSESFPIFTLKVGAFSVPIRLVNDASVVQVSSLPTRVGQK